MKQLDICYCFDEIFAPYALISMISAITNKNNNTKYCFHIGHANLSEATKQKFFDKIHSNIAFYDIDRKEFDNFRCTVGHITEAAAYRLMMPNILKQHGVNKFLYVDCDTLILDDLSNLLDIDMEDYAIGTVLDICYKEHSIRKGNKYYFNSGVILFDCAKWIEGDYFNKVRTALNHPSNTLPDQDALNRVFHNKHVLMPIRYNTMMLHNTKMCDYSGGDMYEYTRAVKNPAIVHCIGAIKPWHSNYPFVNIRQKFLDYALLADVKIENSSGGSISVQKTMSRATTAQWPAEMHIDASGIAYDVATNKRID